MSYPYLSRAVVITSANNGIHFKEGVNTATAAVAVGVYFLGTTGAGTLNAAMKAALEAATASTNTYSVTATVNADPAAKSGVVTVTRATGADNFQLLLANVATTFPIHAIGFKSDDTADNANPKAGTLSPSAWWIGSDMLTLDEPDFDGEVFGDTPTRGGRYLAGARSSVWEKLTWRTQYIHAMRVFQRDNGGDVDATWQAFWARTRDGSALQVGRMTTPTATPTLEPGTWVLDELTRERLNVTRLSAGSPLYSWPITLRKQVTP